MAIVRDVSVQYQGVGMKRFFLLLYLTAQAFTPQIVCFAAQYFV